MSDSILIDRYSFGGLAAADAFLLLAGGIHTRRRMAKSKSI